MSNKTCRISNCERPVIARLMCSVHYRRWLHNGDPFTLKRAPNGSGSVTRDGYLVFDIKGTKVKEHRRVMEQTLGRKLKREELVHHIDGDKLNNSPENLMLVSRPDHLKHHAGFRDATHKECTACRQIKPRSEFHRKPHSGNEDAHMTRCKACMVPVQRRKYLKRIGRL